jgi:preprotein translocase subunit Sec63
MGTDYYNLLGVDKNANDDDIKKAYKKMVRFVLSESSISGLMNNKIGLEMASRSQ